MRIDVLTLFPEFFRGIVTTSLLGKAVERGLVEIRLHQIRNFATDRHRTVDDAPYGGGHGMVMKPEPIVTALEALAPAGARRILMSARGTPFTQQHARELAAFEPGLVLVCGRYEGVDERVSSFVDEQLCIGDYVLSGGEAAAAVVIDAVVRLVPGVIGNLGSLTEESFAAGMLEYPQFTRPEVFRGMRVPEVLLSGNHAEIERWRRNAAQRTTAARRPDLLDPAKHPNPPRRGNPEKNFVKSKVYVALLHYPALSRDGQVVTTSITNMDIHDIARSSRTFGVRRFFVVHPIPGLRALSERVVEHWRSGYGSRYNPSRREAIALVEVESDLDRVLAAVEQDAGRLPRLVATSARPRSGMISFEQLAQEIETSEEPTLLILGTGFGLADEILERCDVQLEPIQGADDYNHLSVRAAAAIILDRLYRASRSAATAGGKAR